MENEKKYHESESPWNDVLEAWIKQYFRKTCFVREFRRRDNKLGRFELTSPDSGRGYVFSYKFESDTNHSGRMAEAEVHYRKVLGRRTLQFVDNKAGLSGFYWEAQNGQTAKS